jgi:hypothetical protein
LKKLWEADPSVAEYLNSIHKMENGEEITRQNIDNTEGDSE